MSSSDGGGSGPDSPAGPSGESHSAEWRRTYDRVEALLPQVQELAADRARLEALNRVRHELSEARENALHARLLQAESSRRRWKAAYTELPPGGNPKLAELQDDDLKDSRTCGALFNACNSEHEIQQKEARSCIDPSQNNEDDVDIARDLREELRKLKQEYESLGSKKDMEVSVLLAEKDFLLNLLTTMDKDNAELLRIKEADTSQAIDVAQKLHQKIEQLQLAARSKDNEIGRLQAETANAKNRVLILDAKLLERHSLAKDKNDDIRKLKDGQPESLKCKCNSSISNETSQKRKKDTSEIHKQHNKRHKSRTFVKWRLIFDRVEAQVEALAASRAQLELLNGILHEFWDARDKINQARLHQAELSKSRWEAAYKELLPGNNPKLTELLESDLEDSRLCAALFDSENSELKIQLKEVGGRVDLDENTIDHDHPASDLTSELRELKQVYESLCSNKDKEIFALLAEKDFVQNQLRTMEKDNVAVLRIKEVEVAQATKAIHKLQKKVKKLQVAVRNKHAEIHRLQAEALSAKNELLVSEGKLDEMHSLAKEKDIHKLKVGQPETLKHMSASLSNANQGSFEEVPVDAAGFENGLESYDFLEDRGLWSDYSHIDPSQYQMEPTMEQGDGTFYNSDAMPDGLLDNDLSGNSWTNSYDNQPLPKDTLNHINAVEEANASPCKGLSKSSYVGGQMYYGQTQIKAENHLESMGPQINTYFPCNEFPEQSGLSEVKSKDTGAIFDNTAQEGDHFRPANMFSVHHNSATIPDISYTPLNIGEATGSMNNGNNSCLTAQEEYLQREFGECPKPEYGSLDMAGEMSLHDLPQNNQSYEMEQFPPNLRENSSMQTGSPDENCDNTSSSDEYYMDVSSPDPSSCEQNQFECIGFEVSSPEPSSC